MDREDSWRAIAAMRIDLAGLLGGLDEPEWEKPSLCAGWRVRDVAAHVAMTPLAPGVRSMLADAVRAGGRFHRFNHDLAVRHASTRAVGALVGELREHADDRRLPVVTNYRNIVLDVLVHGRDIAIPLGRELPVPSGVGVAAATRAWTMGWPFWAKRRLRGLRLVATDADWTAGDGEEVRGPIDALVLLLTGRTATAVPRLTGPGLPRPTA
ncbi:maleylpyruvate isomerase family mycothiol-dependent enzyme [Actinoplanes subtropicus]|uniref:maleylpyruvate isomerase family mycothiol-dependent enzyme n=1 Tax=Actinoplanes subtropicus TaxID=543632 RepID=UPI0004C3A8A0|nr:maleylpyruvate isomerase family mycothiol-dependent enzyme [Actinoplanes subtropicus]